MSHYPPPIEGSDGSENTTAAESVY